MPIEYPELSKDDSKLLNQLGDLMGELRKRGSAAAGSVLDGAKSAQAAEAAQDMAQQASEHAVAEAEASSEASEWDLNNTADVKQLLEHRFHVKDLEKAGYTIKQFERICDFYIEQTRRRSPKASLGHHVKTDLDKGVFATPKARVDWLKAFGSLRASQFIAKPSKGSAK